MTDRQRAAELIHRIADATDGLAAIEVVTEAFVAVRLEERRAIVAWIRGSYAADALASRIERGELGT